MLIVYPFILPPLVLSSLPARGAVLGLDHSGRTPEPGVGFVLYLARLWSGVLSSVALKAFEGFVPWTSTDTLPPLDHYSNRRGLFLFTLHIVCIIPRKIKDCYYYILMSVPPRIIQDGFGSVSSTWLILTSKNQRFR